MYSDMPCTLKKETRKKQGEVACTLFMLSSPLEFHLTWLNSPKECRLNCSRGQSGFVSLLGVTERQYSFTHMKQQKGSI